MSISNKNSTPTEAQDEIINREALLRVAICAVGYELDLSSEETARVIGKNYTFFASGYTQDEVDPDTQKLVDLLFQLHRKLSARVNHNLALMRRWMSTPNRNTGGIPRLQIQDPNQLEVILQCIDEPND